MRSGDSTVGHESAGSATDSSACIVNLVGSRGRGGRTREWRGSNGCNSRRRGNRSITALLRKKASWNAEQNVVVVPRRLEIVVVMNWWMMMTFFSFRVSSREGGG